jgi:hypothetical protein
MEHFTTALDNRAVIVRDLPQDKGMETDLIKEDGKVIFLPDQEDIRHLEDMGMDRCQVEGVEFLWGQPFQLQLTWDGFKVLEKASER